MDRRSAHRPHDVSNERAEQWLRTLGYAPEPEPVWIRAGEKPDFFGHGATPVWVEVKTLEAPRHLAVMDRAWADLRARCARVEATTGDLYAVIGDDYDEKAAKWLIGSVASDAATERRVDVVVVPADPVYDATVRLEYATEEGLIVQSCARSESGRYTFYPGLEPNDWSKEVQILHSDGSKSAAALYDVLEADADAKLAVRIFPSATPLQLRSTIGAGARENRSVWRVRQEIRYTNRQLRNGQRYQAAAGVCAIYQDGLDALGEQQVLAALFGDLTIPVMRNPTQLGPAFLGRNGVLSPTKNRGVSAVRYERAATSVTIVVNPWAAHPIDARLFRQPAWVFDGDRLVLRE